MKPMKNFLLGNGVIKMARWAVVKNSMRCHEGEIRLPERATECSGGYDFFSPCNVTILPHSKSLIMTDVKAYFDSNQELLLNVRSSQGIKHGIILANTQGWVESDFADNPQTDGNIGFCLFNTSDKPYEIHKGDKIGQAMLIHYDTFENGNTNVKRMGGIGSTGR